MNYPLDMPVWASLMLVIGLTVVSYVLARKDNSSSPIGLAALMIAIITAWAWFPTLPVSAAVVALAVTAALFGIGCIKPLERDDPWHYGALISAWLLKLIMWLVPLIGQVLSGEVTIRWWMPVLLMAIIVIAWSKRVRGTIRGLFHHDDTILSNEAPAPGD